MLALLVLHHAKLLASSQSILALGAAPMRVVSRWCRCIVQQLCATDCKRPCLVGRQPHAQPRHGCRACMPKGFARTQSPPSIHSLSRERGLGIGIKSKHFFGTTDFSTNKTAPDHISRERFSVFDLFMPTLPPAHQSVPRLRHSVSR